MKKNRSNIILAIIFLIGLSVMLYPSFSNYWNSRVQSRAVASYNNDVQKMSKQDYKRMFQEADDYNEELNKIDHPLKTMEIPGYDDILNVSGTGIIGYVTIDRIKNRTANLSRHIGRCTADWCRTSGRFQFSGGRCRNAYRFCLRIVVFRPQSFSRIWTRWRKEIHFRLQY